MTRVRKWVRDIAERHMGGPPFAIGDVVQHPSGRTVKIIAGKYWGERGLSNFWSWQEVRKDGKLGKIEHGYGWRPPKEG